MPKVIRAGRWLTCGCCGEDFKTWTGYEDQDQDKGYGICKQHQEDIAADHEREWDKAIDCLCGSLNEENQVKFNAMPRDEQKVLVVKALEDGVMEFSVVRSN